MVSQYKTRTRWAICAALVLFISLIFWSMILASAKHHHQPTQASPLVLAPNSAHKHPAKVPTQTQTIQIKPGDTLVKILLKTGADLDQVNRLVYGSSMYSHLTALKPSTKISVSLDNTHNIQQIKIPINSTKTLWVTRQGDHFKDRIVRTPLIKTTVFKNAVVTTSIDKAAIKNHIPLAVLYQFQHIFRGSINFSQQVKRGDHFDILYNEYYQNGQPHHSGKILVAQYVHNQSRKTAVYFHYPHHDGYYNLHAKGLEPLFLKVPLHYKRISSYFSMHRLDPILHIIRPHLGVDYAAHTGTPIHSIGRGKVIFKGWSHGYGNTVKIRYNKHDVALYAHMSRFAHIQLAQYVKKGQIIGYVGMTGWATGPHLHFGWYVNGIAKNPLKRKVTFNPAIPSHYRGKFFAASQILMDRLHLQQGPILATTRISPS